ncbi:MAG: hypothetical protein EBX03_06175 [Rhodobacteraceae bacterium]|nr:hypothetical protein [Paracoccaceae bacterium]
MNGGTADRGGVDPGTAVPNLDAYRSKGVIKPDFAGAIAAASARCRGGVGGSRSNVDRADFDDGCTSAVFEEQAGAGAIGVKGDLAICNRCGGALIRRAAANVLMGRSHSLNSYRTGLPDQSSIRRRLTPRRRFQKCT